MLGRRWIAAAVAGLAGSVAGVGLAIVPVVGARSSTVPATIEAQQLSGSSTVHAGFVASVAENPDLVAVQWDGDTTARYAIQTRRADGQWRTVTEVGDISDHAADPETPEARRSLVASGRHASDPVWVGRARAVRVALVEGSARNIGVSRIDSPTPASTNAAGAATVAMPGIVSRNVWGADENLRLANCPEPPDTSTNAKLGVVHHTAGSNNYGPGDSSGIVRGLYGYATQTLKYCDTHYNFFVDRFGQIFEGRFGSVWDPVRAAHTTGMNTGTIGVAVIGNFQTTAVPAATADALARLLAWKLNLHGVDPTRSVGYTTISGTDRWPAGSTHALPFIVGHRDPGQTSCPGERLYALLPALRTSVALRILGGGADTVSGHAIEGSKPKAVVMNSDGTVYPAGGAPELRSTSVWPHWAIARDVALSPSGSGGYVLDGFGALHPFGFSARVNGPYWPGFPIGRDVVLRDAGSGWVLDGWGGIHSFGGAPVLRNGPYWSGWDVARKLVRFADGWYVLDAYGALHSVGGAPRVTTPYWPGWPVARDAVANPDGPGGYILDGFGGVFAVGGAPKLSGTAYFGRDVAKGLVVLSGGRGYTLRDDGLLARFGGAPTLSQSRNTWPNAEPITTPWSVAAVAAVP